MNSYTVNFYSAYLHYLHIILSKMRKPTKQQHTYEAELQQLHTY